MPLAERLQAVVESGLPGVVAVASRPGFHEEGAVGLANIETGEPLTVEHRFRVASVTKIFIATAVLQLVGEGAIELDGDAGPLVPGVTARQLLNHTSGVPNVADDLTAFLEPYRRDPAHKSELGPREMLALALERPRLFEPGEGWAYTGSNYQAVGLLVEATTEATLRTELKRRIFDPLALGATDLREQTWPVEGLAREYLPADNPLIPGPGPAPVDATELDLPFNWKGGGIVSTGRDLARFLQALLGGELLPDDLRAEMLRTVPSDWPESDGYGLGLCKVSSLMGMSASPCGSAWGHLGLGGYATIALASEDGRRQVVVMVNRTRCPKTRGRPSARWSGAATAAELHHAPYAAVMDGWETWQRQAPDGAIESEQRVALTRPVVEFSTAGAQRLGHSYWREVRRVTGSLVRPRERGGALELRLLGGPVLLRFDRPTLGASEARAFCSYPIAGGLLARRAAGELTFEQTPGALSSTIRGFFPRVASYDRLQGRLHVAISRRFFRRLIAEARR